MPGFPHFTKTLTIPNNEFSKMQHEPKSKITEAKIVKNAHSNRGLIFPSLTNVHVSSHTGKNAQSSPGSLTAVWLPFSSELELY